MEGFDWCETRQHDWADVATIHRNHCNTYLWKFRCVAMAPIFLAYFKRLMCEYFLMLCRNRVITETILRQPSWKANPMVSLLACSYAIMVIVLIIAF
jgi:hypothetical protein